MSLTIGDQNAIKSCRWSSSFYLHAVLILSNHREAPRAAEHGQARRARPDGDASQEETTDTGDEPVAVGCGTPEGKERERERESMYSNESRAMKKSQRSREDKRGDASIRVIDKTD